MSVHKCGSVIVLKWTTEQQLELIKKELEQRFNEVDTLWKLAQEQADCTDQIDPDLDNLWNGLINICSDLGMEEFEMS